MRIPIRLEEGHGVPDVLDQWAWHLENALRERFPLVRIAREESDHEVILVLSEKAAARGEVALRWDPALPDEITMLTQPAREAAESKAKADALAMRVAVACAIAACALWLGAVAGLWGEFMKLSDERDRWALIAIGAFAWVASTAGLAVLSYYLVQRSHRAIDAPRQQRSRQWLDTEVWPSLLEALDELSQRARTDEELAQRLAADF